MQEELEREVRHASICYIAATVQADSQSGDHNKVFNCNKIDRDNSAMPGV